MSDDKQPLECKTIAGTTKAEMLSLVREFEIDGDPASGLHVPEARDLATVVNAMGELGFKVEWGPNARAKLREDIPRAFLAAGMRAEHIVMTELRLDTELLEATAQLADYAAGMKALANMFRDLPAANGRITVSEELRAQLVEYLDGAAELVDDLAQGVEGDLEDQQREDANGG